MKTYALIFRMDITTQSAQPSPEQMEVYMQDWMKWLDFISAKGQLAEGGNHFSYKVAKVLRPGNIVTEGPYEVNKESVAGYILVFANDLDSAVRIAKKCPILQGEGTSVEVRETEAPQA
jgi:hypothetical protein